MSSAWKFADAGLIILDSIRSVAVKGCRAKTEGVPCGRSTASQGGDRDARFAPTIVMGREGGVLQRLAPGSTVVCDGA